MFAFIAFALLIGAQILLVWYLLRRVVNHTNSMATWVEDYTSHREVQTNVKSLLSSLVTLSTAAEKAITVSRLLDEEITKVIDFTEMFEGRQDHIVDVLTSRTVERGMSLTAQMEGSIVQHVEQRVVRALRDVITTKVAHLGSQYVVINDLEALDLDLDIQLANVRDDVLRKSLVATFAQLRFKGKPSERQQAEEWVNNALGSDRDFRQVVESLGRFIAETRWTGSLIIKRKPQPLTMVRAVGEE